MSESHESPDELRRSIRDLFRKRRLAALATVGEGAPYQNLVAFAGTEDLGEVAFATARETRKYRNLLATPRVAMLVSDSANDESDFAHATAVTIIGEATETDGAPRELLEEIYLAKHPSLEGFVTSPDCALFRVAVEEYLVVTRFQSVARLAIG